MDTTLKLDPGFLAMVSSRPAVQDEEEARWVARARTGDEAAYRWLLERYRLSAVRLAAHVLRRDSEAEDIAQEAFLQAFRQLGHLRSVERFGPWLYRIVVHISLDQMRRKRWHSELSSEAIDSLAEAASTKEVNSKLLVETLLDKLNPRMRAALVLRELEGLEYEEIAAVLQIPVGTVRSRLNSARAQFRSLWEATEADNAAI